MPKKQKFLSFSVFVFLSLVLYFHAFLSLQIFILYTFFLFLKLVWSARVLGRGAVLFGHPWPPQKWLSAIKPTVIESKILYFRFFLFFFFFNLLHLFTEIPFNHISQLIAIVGQSFNRI